MEQTCRNCGSEMRSVVRNVEHKMFDRIISILNAPVVECTTCTNGFYVSAQKLDHTLRDAYRLGIDQVEYKL
jgi:YgiT-type zinc finger domain-containing protein